MDFSDRLRTLSVLALAGTLLAACHSDKVDSSSGGSSSTQSTAASSGTGSIKPTTTSSQTGSANPDTGTGVSNATRSRRFHHFNNNAWHGRGVALVQCNGQAHFAGCTLVAGGSVQTMQKHGNLDKGRPVWTIYSSPSINGVVQCRVAGSNTVLEFGPFSRGGSIVYGDC